MEGTLQITVSIAGITITGIATRDYEGLVSQDVDLPAGKSGTLTTRTDVDTGVATVAEGHGITDSDYVDVYWDGGMRYKMDVTATTGTTISIDSGDGDDLPAQDTVIVVTKRVEIAAAFDGDDLKLIGAAANKRAHIEFTTSGDVSIKAVELPVNEGWGWVCDQGITNPLAGSEVAKIQATCGDGSSATTLKVAALYDSA